MVPDEGALVGSLMVLAGLLLVGMEKLERLEKENQITYSLKGIPIKGEAKRERETICHQYCKCEITAHNRRRCDQDRLTVIEVDYIFRKVIVTSW